MSGPTRAEQRRQQALARRLADAGFILPGKVLTRYMRCGKPNCRCQNDPDQRHGPYLQWNRMVDGKTRTLQLPPETLQHYQQWFDNAEQLRSTLVELEALAVTIIERDRKNR